MHSRLRTIHQIILFLFISILIIILLQIESTKYLKYSKCPTLINSLVSIDFNNMSSNIEDDKYIIDDLSILCLDMGLHIDNEKYIGKSPLIYAPSYNNSQILFRFPYRYSQWKSSLELPRLITPCEHNLYMNLLRIIDRICRQKNITYFMAEGTLLGSLRHHDLIPWDDDTDILMSYRQRKIFLNEFKQINQTLIDIYIYRSEVKTRSYYKLFYKNTPYAGEYTWRYPFVDIFFYDKNQTHLWDLKDVETPIKLTYIFPLILRPFGQLWLPSPRKPRKFFQFNPFDKCIGHYWDHRNEIEKEEIIIKCDKIKDIYPFVEQSNRTNSIEILKINNSIIHTVIYK